MRESKSCPATDQIRDRIDALDRVAEALTRASSTEETIGEVLRHEGKRRSSEIADSKSGTEESDDFREERGYVCT